MTDPTFHVDWDEEHGRGDPEQRWRIYRLCECAACDGTGKEPGVPVKGAGGSTMAVGSVRCSLCRGEGRTRELVATCASPEAVGVTIVTLGAEGEFDDCPVGILDTEGEVGHKWVLRPWLPSPRNVSDAGRVLATARKRGGASD